MFIFWTRFLALWRNVIDWSLLINHFLIEWYFVYQDKPKYWRQCLNNFVIQCVSLGKSKIRLFISDALHLWEAYPSLRGVHVIGICCNVADLSLNFTTKRTTCPHIIFSFWFCGVMRTYTFHMITPLAAITHQKLRFKQSECMLKWLNHLITISRGTLKIFHSRGSSWASWQDLLSLQKKFTSWQLEM